MTSNEITGESERIPIRPGRRAFGKAVLAGILAGPTAMSSIVQAAKEQRPSSRSGAGGRGMKVALMLRPENQDMWVMPGGDKEIDNDCAVIEALGKVGIPMCCYNFMAGIGWYRTKVDIPERGGALASEFDNRFAEEQGLTEWGKISEEKIWENMTYFLERIIPVAEKAGVKMALHPDDPPLSPLRGIGRLLTSADGFRRVLRIVPSPVNGLAFCQANFQLMGEDIKSLVREFCGQGKIFFVHLRDVTGTREHFRETFHDNGPTDMPGMLKLYHEVGFRGPIRPDHAPTLAAETNERPGYAMQGKIFAIGYMKGIAQALNIPLM